MVEVGVLAYPLLLGAMYGVVRIGRDERWGVYEWLRLGTLCLLLGLVVAVQVKFAMLGLVQDPLAVASALFSIAGVAGMLALYLWRHWQGQAAPKREPPAPTAG